MNALVVLLNRQGHFRAWKLTTFAIGLTMLIVGSFYYQAPDWDIPISIIMVSFTYLTAGWSMRVILLRQWRHWPLIPILTWWSVEGCYALYWSWVDIVALEFMRDANWPAPLSLHWICGLLWAWNGSLRDAASTLAQELHRLFKV